jgi:D-3-phosphoglycerate dehydrogenase
LINASRGNNVDETALYQALKKGEIAGAGLDSYQKEPKKEEGKTTESMQNLATLDNVVLSAHLGASTHEAQAKTGAEVAGIVIDYLLEGNWINALNVGEQVTEEDKPKYSVFIHHKDVPDMFTQIDAVFGKNNINIRENRSRHMKHTDTALAVYFIEQKPNDTVLQELRNIPNVYTVKD